MASMATSSSLNSIPLSSSSSLSAPSIRAFSESNFHFPQNRNHHSNLTVKAQTLDFTSSFFEGGFGSGDDPFSPAIGFPAVEEKPEPQCPPGLRQYETMVVLRPDMSEDERLALTQKYEELLVAGGGMYVEVFNRGIIPLSYSIQKKNKEGETNTYMDGIYLLFTYFTKPESLKALEQTLLADDNVVRSTSFKIIKKKKDK
ncbi:small ribosomal subunit protein bS6c [Vicia villosa]|uniref:small ribosomal subunit protein bS6c n=1 Tax=Vicia villosa TaxID=3911 RepID=UPI00273CD62C|nr:small ribosomal subunit protein bS6c [Vicia villosa]